MTITTSTLDAYLNEFVNAMMRLSDAWDNERLDDGYPFLVSFDELLFDVMDWRDKVQRGKTRVRMVRYGGRNGPTIEGDFLWQSVIDDNVAANDDPFFRDPTITETLMRDGKVACDDCVFYLIRN